MHTAPVPLSASDLICRFLLAGIAKFHIGWCFGNKKDFDLEVPFCGSLSGAQLRAAIAEARGFQTKSLTLEQRRFKRSDGATTIRVLEGGGWVDQEGREATGEGMLEDHIIEDDEPVVLPRSDSDLHCWIDVYEK